MSKYSYLNIIKMHSKAYAKAEGLPLAKVHEMAAKSVGFADYHELSKVTAANPEDVRLLRLALDLNDLSQAIERDAVREELDSELEDSLSGYIADTNASAFNIGDIDVLSATWDSSKGFLGLLVDLDYGGDQDPERPWCGSVFYIKAELILVYRSGQWSLHDEGLKILSCESDRDRDHNDEIDYMATITD